MTPNMMCLQIRSSQISSYARQISKLRFTSQICRFVCAVVEAAHGTGSEQATLKLLTGTVRSGYFWAYCHMLLTASRDRQGYDSLLLQLSMPSMVTVEGFRNLIPLTAFKNAPDPKFVQNLSQRLCLGVPVRRSNI